MYEEHVDLPIRNVVEKESPKKFKPHPWMVVSIVLGVAVVLLFFLNGGITGMTVVSKDKAGQLMVDFLNEKVGGGVELIDVAKEGNLYEITVNYQGQDIPVFMTKDGRYFISGVEAMTDDAVIPEPDTQQNIPKTNKPIVELFVMTHCPYGTQAEKGFIPAMKTLGDNADMTIRFVHYFLHAPEETETPIQVCIREEQSDKFLPYLEAFLESGDSDAALVAAGVDKAKMQQCIDNGNADEYYAEDSELSQTYGVRGSPTLIINGVQSSAGRDAQSYLDGICEAFLDAPSECDTAKLSSTSPSPGFGYQEGEATTAQC